VEHFGSARRALAASQAELQEVPGFGPSLSAGLVSSLRTIDVSAEVARLGASGVDVFAIGQPGYPSSLATIPDAPTLLFVRGTLLPTDARAVALVGTRNPNAYGRKMAKTLAEGLARAGVVVVSGLPHGTPLDTFLTIPFGGADFEAWQAEVQPGPIPLRGEDGKLIGSRRREKDSGPTCTPDGGSLA
jgi:hypothetical protein